MLFLRHDFSQRHTTCLHPAIEMTSAWSRQQCLVIKESTAHDQSCHYDVVWEMSATHADSAIPRITVDCCWMEKLFNGSIAWQRQLMRLDHSHMKQSGHITATSWCRQQSHCEYTKLSVDLGPEKWSY